MPMSECAEFDRFVDFMVRMIEKYGTEIKPEMTASKLDACIPNKTEDDVNEDQADTPGRGCHSA
jgi:hypothetical protein